MIERLLDERESSVLRALVYEYISTGRPVGSRSFVQKYSFSLSPATMRNIMYDLEGMGYLQQPHTSAGRIPTDRGYRFYVDSLLDSYDFNESDVPSMQDDQIRHELHLEKIFSSITRMLSSVSALAGIMLTPHPDFTVLKRIELIPLDSNEVLAVLLTRTGIILNRRVALSATLTQDQVYDFSRFLTGELCGYSLDEIQGEVLSQMRERADGTENRALAIDIAELVFSASDESKLFIDGIENLLRIPEMVEDVRLNSLLNIIEDSDILRDILEVTLESDGVATLIGDEIDHGQVGGCSLVTTTYRIGNRRVGAVGVLGPTRMDYEKVVPLVDYTGRAVSQFLTGMSK